MSALIIRSASNRAVVAIEPLETTSSYSSVRVSVDINDDGFSGSYDQVWIAEDALRAFVEQLRACERGRQGSASVAALSPEEFELTVE